MTPVSSLAEWPKIKQEAILAVRRSGRTLWIEDTQYGWHPSPVERPGAYAKIELDAESTQRLGRPIVRLTYLDGQEERA